MRYDFDRDFGSPIPAPACSGPRRSVGPAAHACGAMSAVRADSAADHQGITQKLNAIGVRAGVHRRDAVESGRVRVGAGPWVFLAGERAMSWVGDLPNFRAYSRLNWLRLS